MNGNLLHCNDDLLTSEKILNQLLLTELTVMSFIHYIIGMHCSLPYILLEMVDTKYLADKW